MTNTTKPSVDLLHKVYKEDLDEYKAGKRKFVESICGKVWAPELPVNLDKEPCLVCSRTIVWTYNVNTVQSTKVDDE